MTDRLLIPTNLDAAKLSASRACGPVRKLAGATMGTGWSLSCVASGVASGVADRTIAEALNAVFDHIIAQMSGWEPSSELSRFNAAPSGWRELSPDFFAVLARALEIAEQTGGAFDPCLADAVEALGFGPSAAVAASSMTTGATPASWRSLRLDPSRRAAFQPGGAALDLSSIAKGFAVDACADRLETMGISSFLMEIGGEFVGRGLKPDGQPWRVELELSDLAQAPGEPTRTLAALPAHALATSGDFVRGAHILDGRTGMPASGASAAGGLSGVAVISDACMDADGWATALFALGADDGFAMAEARGLVAVFAVRATGGSFARLTAKAQDMLA